VNLSRSGIVWEADLQPVGAEVLGVNWQCTACKGWARIRVTGPQREFTVEKGAALEVTRLRPGISPGTGLSYTYVEGSSHQPHGEGAGAEHAPTDQKPVSIVKLLVLLVLLAALVHLVRQAAVP
jgi:hypothetical protein